MAWSFGPAEAHLQDHARWLLGIGVSGRVRAQFFTLAGSIWRSTDYYLVVGRLWRWITVEYTYPYATRRYDQDESTMMTKSKFRPDGTGAVDFVDRVKRGDVARLRPLGPARRPGVRHLFLLAPKQAPPTDGV